MGALSTHLGLLGEHFMEPVSITPISIMSMVRKSLCVAIGCAALVVSAHSPIVLAKDKPRSKVADPRYGVALYNYYREEYMDALSELLIAKERGGIQGHGDNPIIWEGGFALAYGMERHAGDIFDRLLAENRSKEVQDAAWFYLANLRYLRGDWIDAEDALRRVREKPKDKSLRYERASLQINLDIKQNRLEQAEEGLRTLPLKQGWKPYLYFNLGSAWARAGSPARGLYFYRYFEDEEFKPGEHRALYDKALTAAGYSLIAIGQPEQAIEKFTKVRLSSHLARRAMLGYGWAAAEVGDFETALKPWLHLSDESLLDENVLEALIAVPYAYEKLGMEGLALLKFQEAEANFEEEIANLDVLIDKLDSDVLLEALKISRNRDLDWLVYAEENELSPHLVYLIYLFSREKFQGLVQELRDLVGIQEDLYTWRYKLGFYLDMLDERDRDHSDKAEALGLSTLQDSIADMERKRATMAEQVASIADSEDALGLASEDESVLLKRIERVRNNIELVREDDPFVDEYEEAARRYEGILRWQASELYSDRLWQAQKSLRGLDAIIADLRATLDNVNTIMARPHDLDPYRTRIAEAQQRLEKEIRRVDVALDISKVDVQSEIVGVLKLQQQRLLAYMGVCRLSMARLYDKATQAQRKAQEEAAASEDAIEPALPSSEQEAGQ